MTLSAGPRGNGLPHGRETDPLWSRVEEELGDRFTVLEQVGKGGAGTVYRVLNQVLNREEALKVLANFLGPREQVRFEAEARTAASLDHPGIVKIYDYGQKKDLFWYSMQLVDGYSLSDLVRPDEPFPEADSLRLTLSILSALAYSHSKGVIHRDIKPANILLNWAGHPFIADFGIAKVHESPLKTDTGFTLGTPAYMSPEQALGHPVDARTDLYALGLTLYELLAGAPPFEITGSIQTLVLRLNTQAPELLEARPDLHPNLAAAVMRCIEREPKDRFASAEEMTYALRQVALEAGYSLDLPIQTFKEKHLRLSTSPTRALKTHQMRGPNQPISKGPPVRKSRQRWGWIAGAGLFLLSILLINQFRTRASPSTKATNLASPVIPATSSVRADQGKTLTSPQISNNAPSNTAQVPRPVEPRTMAPPGKDGALSNPSTPRRPVQYPQPEESVPPDVHATPDCAGKTLNFSVRVGEDGRVQSCRLLSTASPACAKAAQDALLKWRFKPALDSDGRPVEAVVSVAVPFLEAP